jgi:[ribosomal protein S18]-alanine N-acetyltransferase
VNATLRSYRPGDFERLYEIDQVCYPAGVPYSRRTLRWYLSLEGADCLVAEVGDAIAGFILTESEGRRGHVITIDVVPEHQHQGVGSLVLRGAEERLGLRGVREIELETATDTESAVAFWRKHGYLTRGRLKNYYPRRRDAWSMTKSLAAPKKEN